MKNTPTLTPSTPLPITLVRKIYHAHLRAEANGYPPAFLKDIPTAEALFGGLKTVTLDQLAGALVLWAVTGAHAERDAQGELKNSLNFLQNKACKGQKFEV